MAILCDYRFHVTVKYFVTFYKLQGREVFVDFIFQFLEIFCTRFVTRTTAIVLQYTPIFTSVFLLT